MLVNKNPWEGKRVLITGVSGTVGSEMLAQLANLSAGEIIGVDRDETALFFQQDQYRDSPNVRLYVVDVLDRDDLSRHMDGVDVVIHAAALKHVVLCEQSPRSAVSTNISGTQNAIEVALQRGVERLVFTSSDKAVNPTSVMGTSKLMAERLVTAANALRRDGKPVFASTRFGNVLGSRGSVIPVFARQIAAGGPVTLTDERMTRFIMTLEEAVSLVMDSVFQSRGGEVFVTKMPTIRIADLAQVMIEELAPRFGRRASDVEILVSGAKPGEKLYEELMNEEEVRRAVELERYFVVKPAFRSVFRDIEYGYEGVEAEAVTKPYNSATERPLDVEELRAYLHEKGLLQRAFEDGSGSVSSR